MPANLEKSAVATGLEKVSFYFNLKERQCQIMLKLSHNCTHFTCQQSNTQNSSNQVSTVHEPRTSRFKLALEKEEEPEIKLSTFVALQKKQENSRKTSISALLTTPKLQLCGSQQTVENSEGDGHTRPPDLPLEKPVCRSGSNSQNWTWNNRLVPNRKRSISRLYIVTLLI